MIIIPAILSTYSSLKDKTLKIVFETNEPTPEQLLGIATNTQQFGYLAFKQDHFKTSEKKVLESIKSEYDDTGKTKGQRLRNVLYKNFEIDKLGYEVFDDYYNHQMEKLINHFKSKLD